MIRNWTEWNLNLACLVAAIVLGWLTVTGCSTPQADFYKRYTTFPGEANQHTRVVNASPERIFQILVDEDRFPAITPPYTEVSFDTPAPYGVGTRLKIEINHLLNFTWHTQVEEMVPNRRIQLAFLDGLFKGGTEVWELEPQGEQTLVIQTIIVQPEGWLRRFIWDFKARNRHNAITEQALDNLKYLSETLESAYLK